MSDSRHKLLHIQSNNEQHSSRRRDSDRRRDRQRPSPLGSSSQRKERSSSRYAADDRPSPEHRQASPERLRTATKHRESVRRDRSGDARHRHDSPLHRSPAETTGHYVRHDSAGRQREHTLRDNRHDASSRRPHEPASQGHDSRQGSSGRERPQGRSSSLVRLALPGPPDPALDFLSPGFDALKALNTPGLEPPLPHILPLSNLYLCRALLPACLPEAASAAVQPISAEKKQERLDRTLQARTAKRRSLAREQGCTLKDIAAEVTKGPLLLLKRCLEGEERVRVVTRHACGLRGVATGRLVAFDKYMNLVMRDVEEEYVVRLRVSRNKSVGRWIPIAQQQQQQQQQQHDEAMCNNGNLLNGEAQQDEAGRQPLAALPVNLPPASPAKAAGKAEEAAQEAPFAFQPISCSFSTVRQPNSCQQGGFSLYAGAMQEDNVEHEAGAEQLPITSPTAPANPALEVVQAADAAIAFPSVLETAPDCRDPRQTGECGSQQEAAEQSPSAAAPAATAGVEPLHQEVNEEQADVLGLQCKHGGAKQLEWKLVEATRVGWKQEHRRRKLKQVFLRGDNIVFINPVLQTGQVNISLSGPKRSFM